MADSASPCSTPHPRVFRQPWVWLWLSVGLQSTTAAAHEAGFSLSVDNSGGLAQDFSLEYRLAEGLRLGGALGASRDSGGGESLDSDNRSLWLETAAGGPWNLRAELRQSGDANALTIDRLDAQLLHDGPEWSFWGSYALGQIRLYADTDGSEARRRVDIHSGHWEAGAAWWRQDGIYLQLAYGRGSYSRDLAALEQDPRSELVFSSTTLGLAAGLESTHLSLAGGRLTEWGAYGLSLRRSASALDDARLHQLGASVDWILSAPWYWRGEVGLQWDEIADDAQFILIGVRYRWDDF